MFETMEEIRREVGRVLREDDFPEGIRPDMLRSAVRDYPCRGGKRLRPALTLWSCGAAGGDPALALYAACAIEVYHNWTLVHDDMIDRDAVRRGEKTSHIKLAECAAEKFSLNMNDARLHGERMALLCGDLQQDWAFSLLSRSPLSAECVGRMQTILQRRGREVISGEALDVEMALRNPEALTVAEIEEMYALKTGALLGGAAELGAVAAGASAAAVDALGGAARNLATAFQLMDDVLGVFGTADKFGKPLGADLRERKPTLLLLETLTRLKDREKQRFQALLGHPVDAAALAEARGLILGCGAYGAALGRIADSVRSGEALLRELPESPYRAALFEQFETLKTRER